MRKIWYQLWIWLFDFLVLLGVIMKKIFLLLALLALNGCSFSYSRDQIGFWDQCIKLDGWGLSYVSPYGPVNVGKLTYERNTNCAKDITQQAPFMVVP